MNSKTHEKKLIKMSLMYCKLCLGNNNEYFTITAALKTKIVKHLGVEIPENALICKRCIQIVESFNQFFIEINKRQNELHKSEAGKKSEVQFIILLEQQNPVGNEVNQVHDENPPDHDDANAFTDSATVDDQIDITTTIPRLDEFPKEIIKDGKLIFKGKELTKMISRFYKLGCDICPSKRFRKFTALVTHFRTQHSCRPYVHCCGVKVTKLRRIALHMARHIQPSAFKCDICNKFLTSPKIKILHLQNHQPEEKRRFACAEPNCNRRFSYQSALVNHALSHLSEEERAVFSCCDKKFANSSRLKMHIATVHSSSGETRRFTCDICTKVFSTKSNLVYHLTTHQVNVNQVQCKVCSKWLKNKICLKKHMTTHSEIKFSCENCEYSSANKQCLVNHQRIHHSDAKPFKCETCGNSFKIKNTLINHINAMHKGLRKYQCEFCEKTFVSSGNYYSHRKRLHSQELAKKIREREQVDKIQRNSLVVKCVD